MAGAAAILATQIGHIVVGVTDDCGPAEAAGVDDAGVVQFVGKDQISLADQGRDGGEVSRETALEGDAGLGFLEGGQALFEGDMRGHGAGDGAHCARADAVLVDGFLGGLVGCAGGWPGRGSCWRRS